MLCVKWSHRDVVGEVVPQGRCGSWCGPTGTLWVVMWSHRDVVGGDVVPRGRCG